MTVKQIRGDGGRDRNAASATDALASDAAATRDLSEFDRGVLVGILIGEGSFGGDGKQPQITLRMHTRHEAIFRWLEAAFPRTKLYGPYHHGQRSYFQWMARGEALVEDVLPILEASLGPDLDGYAAARLDAMRTTYADYIARVRARTAP